MKLILARHGNTFGPGDPVVWTGKGHDLPLVDEGRRQAERLANALGEARVDLDAVYCSPLTRASEYAEIVSHHLGLPVAPTRDPRIGELDYGAWTGLTNDEVEARYGAQALRAWDERSEWPAEGHWGGSPAEAVEEVHAFVSDLRQRHGDDRTVLVVTHNGRLRYFLTLVPQELERRVAQGAFKVKTGNLCTVVGSRAEWIISHWNVPPRALLET